MKDLTQGKIFKTMFKFAIPLVIALLMTQTYNLVDLLIAGRCIGDDALSATGATTTFIQFFSSIFWGYSIALSTTVGKYYGERNNEGIIKVLKTGLLFISIVVIGMSAITMALCDPILHLFKVDPAIYDLTKVYFLIYIGTIILQAILHQVNVVLQALGDSKMPMIMTILSGVFNIGLNLLFVLVFKWGVAGLAIATAISTGISLVIGIIKVSKYAKELGGNLKPGFDKKEFKHLFKIAIPSTLQQCSLYLSGIVIQPWINVLGKDYTAAWSLAMNINLLFNAIYHGVSRTVASYSSQSLGAKKYDNFSRGIAVGFALQAILNLPLILATMIFPEAVFSIFLRDGNANVLYHATRFAYFCVPFVLVCAYGNLMHSFYKSVESVNTVLLSTFLFTVARIIITYFLPRGESLMFAYLGLSLGWVVEAIILLLVYNLSFRKKINKLKLNVEV